MQKAAKCENSNYKGNNSIVIKKRKIVITVIIW